MSFCFSQAVGVLSATAVKLHLCCMCGCILQINRLLTLSICKNVLCSERQEAYMFPKDGRVKPGKGGGGPQLLYLLFPFCSKKLIKEKLTPSKWKQIKTTRCSCLVLNIDFVDGQKQACSFFNCFYMTQQLEKKTHCNGCGTIFCPDFSEEVLKSTIVSA